MAQSTIIVPYIQPQAETAQLIDDSTAVFRPSQAPGIAQRVSFVEPRLQVKQSWKSLRAQDRGVMLAAIGAARGKYGSVRAPVGFARRGVFPGSELLPHPTFDASTTGWIAASVLSLSVADRVMRITRTAQQAGYVALQNNAALTVTQYMPYVARFAFQSIFGEYTGGMTVRLGATSGNTEYGENSARSLDPSDVVFDVGVAYTTSLWVALIDYTTTAFRGALDVPYTSVQQCALVDGSQNLCLYSDDLSNAFWGKHGCTAGSNVTAAPDGTTTADQLIEDTSTGNHWMESSTVNVSSAVVDCCASVCLKASGRTWAAVNMVESTNSTAAQAFINLSTGALGNVTAGAQWANIRAFVTSLGNGWYRLSIVARKTNAATSVYLQILSASGNGSSSTTGLNAGAYYFWRAGLNTVGAGQQYPAGSVPGIPAQTTSAAVAYTTSGNYLQLKGLPASTSGLVLRGDLLEAGNGQLVMAMSQLDSDASGCGTLQCTPALARPLVDGDPVIIGSPMGRFILGDNASWTNQYGAYMDLDLTLEAVTE